MFVLYLLFYMIFMVYTWVFSTIFWKFLSYLAAHLVLDLVEEEEIEKQLQFLLEGLLQFGKLTSRYNMMWIPFCVLVVGLYDFYGMYMNLYYCFLEIYRVI